MMVEFMAKKTTQTETDALVQKARTDAGALGSLYRLYYERVFAFCVHRLFNKTVAEDVTSAVFLDIASGMRRFKGQRERDFANWLFAVAINHTNAYIRKTARRDRLLKEAARSIIAVSRRDESCPDWPQVYSAILKLKPNHQTIITLRFFENMPLGQIAGLLNMKETAVRVSLHRALKKLKKHLQSAGFGE
jgi:RNA polymerase sigma-70 factor (ECF subfamily)